MKPFNDIIAAIENEEPPFVPEYNESGEPQYLEEWMDARTGVESVGLAALSMIASSLKLFLDDWVSDLETGDRRYKRTHKKGWFYAYCRIIEEVGLDLRECPADLELIEQAILARNRGQHPEELALLKTVHSKNDLEKYPSPYFVSKTDKRILDLENGEISWWLSPNVYVDYEKLQHVLSEITKLADWLQNQYFGRNNA